MCKLEKMERRHARRLLVVNISKKLKVVLAERKKWEEEWLVR